MNGRSIGYGIFTDGTTRPIYEDERGQFVIDVGERIDGLFLVPAEEDVDEPVMVDR